jgi:competence protein ComEC
MPHTTKTYEKVMALVEQKEIRYIEGKRDQEFGLGSEVKLQILHPQTTLLRNTRSDLNSNSVIIRMIHGDNCFLFTGDAEEPTEAQLVRQDIGPCDVLKVPHHGSNHSSTTPFLNEVAPKIAVISLGVDNRYGHPGEEAMERLERTGAEIYRTDTMGTVTITSDGKKLKVQTKKEAVVHKVDAGKVKEIAHITTDTTVIKDATGKFDINTATQSQLESISGIGPSKALAIIAYRNENGPFTNINELGNVSGIGPKTVEKISAAAYVISQ